TLDGVIEHALDPIWNKPLGAHPFVVAGLEADAYLRATRTSPKALASVVAKNRGNGLRNPLAAYGAAVDVDQAIRSEERFAPLRALDISNPADGCVVLVLAAERAAKKLHANPVWIRGIGWASDSPSLETRDWAGATYARLAADMAFHPEWDRRRGRPGGGRVTKVGVIGAGMTLFRRRLQETGKELCFEATKMALDSAGITRGDVDMVLCGTAPDAFDGVAMKGEYLLDGSAGFRKPYTRVFTGGGTGVFSTIAGWWHVASGLADVALVVNEEKMSSCQPHPQSVFANIWDPILDRPLQPN